MRPKLTLQFSIPYYLYVLPLVLCTFQHLLEKESVETTIVSTGSFVFSLDSSVQMGVLSDKSSSFSLCVSR